MRKDVTALLALALILVSGVWLWNWSTDRAPVDQGSSRTTPVTPKHTGTERTSSTKPQGKENSTQEPTTSAPRTGLESAPIAPGQLTLMALWACAVPQPHATCLGTAWEQVESQQGAPLQVLTDRPTQAPPLACKTIRGSFLVPITPGFAATPQSLAPGSTSLIPTPHTADPLRVQVIPAQGTRLAAYDLEVRCLSDTDQAGQRVGFVLRRTVSANEPLELPAFQGLAKIIARSGDLAGSWAGSVRLTHNKEIEIHLGPSFSLAGYINQVPQEEDLSSYRVSVRPKGSLPNAAIAECHVDKSGFWDLEEIHAAAGAELLVAVSGGIMLPQTKQIMAPPGGTLMTVNFDWKAGLPGSVIVTDTQGSLLGGVEVQGFWYDNEEAAYTMVRARTSSQGLAKFASLAVGEISFALREPGWSGTQYDYIHPKQNSEPYVLKVSPSTILQGTVRRKGLPVPNFQLAFNDERGHVAWKWFRDRTDGSYLINDAPSGPVSVIVYSLDWEETGNTHDLNIPPGTTKILDLELESNTLARGQVVSASTGQPIEGAWLTSKEPLGTTLIDVEREFTISDAEGRFEGLALAPSSSWVYVAAHGYQPTTLAAGGNKLDPDLGRIVLNAAGTLTLRLEPPPGNEIWTLVERGRPQFSPDGVLVLQDRGAGSQRLTFEPPWGAFVEFYVTPRGSPPWEVVLQRPVGRKIIFVLEAEDGGPYVPGSVQGLRLSWSESAGEAATLLTTYLNQETGEATIEGIPQTWISAAVILNSKDACHLELDARAAGDLRLKVRLKPDSGHVRFIDSNSHPMSNLAAYFQMTPGVRARFEATSRNGIVNLAGASGKVRYLLSGKTQETVFTGTIQVTKGNTETLTETIDSSHNMGVHFTERGKPASYLTAMITPVGWAGSYQVKITSDHGGNTPAHACSPGKYRVTPIDGAYWHEPLTFHSSASGPAVLEVRRVGDLGVRALFGEDPLVGITISLHNQERDTDVSTWVIAGRVDPFAVTDQDGRTLIRGIPSGLYTVQAQLSSGLASVQVQVIGGSETWVSLGSQ